MDPLILIIITLSKNNHLKCTVLSKAFNIYYNPLGVQIFSEHKKACEEQSSLVYIYTVLSKAFNTNANPNLQRYPTLKSLILTAI